MVEDANPKRTFWPGQFVVVPLKITNRGGITAEGYQTVPILCYHRFSSSCDSPLCMPAAVFEQQLRYLKQNGYRVIGPEALIDFLDYRKAIPQKAVMISIDDGYRLSVIKKVWIHGHLVNIHRLCGCLQKGHHLGPIARAEA
jgi:hypothetical protein